jgi:hypothetical protein
VQARLAVPLKSGAPPVYRPVPATAAIASGHPGSRISNAPPPKRLLQNAILAKKQPLRGAIQRGPTIVLARRAYRNPHGRPNPFSPPGVIQEKGIAVSFLGFNDTASIPLFNNAVKNLRDEKKISESYSSLSGGWTIGDGDDVYILGHCNGYDILGMSGKAMADYVIKKGLKNVASKIVLVACGAGMQFVDDFNAGLLAGFKAAKLNVTVFASQENVTAGISGSVTGKRVESLGASAALNQAYAEHKTSSSSAAAAPAPPKPDPFAGLVTFPPS